MKIYFEKAVRYKGVTYPPNTPLEIKESQLESMIKDGGKLLKPTEFEETKTEKEILKEKALELGINIRGNWGIKKLNEAIEEALKGE